MTLNFVEMRSKKSWNSIDKTSKLRMNEIEKVVYITWISDVEIIL